MLSTLLIFACSNDDSKDDYNNSPSNCDIVYLDDNGITIKACDDANIGDVGTINGCLLYTSPSPRDKRQSRMPSSA